MSDEAILASVIVVGYNSRSDLQDCLSSVCSQTLDSYEIIFVDNDSDDESVEFVQNQFPSVRVIANNTNRWYAGGNNDGLQEARGEYLVILNPDVKVKEDWLEKLIETLRNDKDIGLTTSRIVHFDDRDKLNTCGNLTHLTGLGFCRGLDKPFDYYDEAHRVGAVSGCSFAMRREIYEKYGGLDESFEHYLEDIDISWRVRLAGYDIIYVPESVVYHKYNFSLPPWKFYNMERNRYMIILKHLQIRTLFKILPALIVTELVIWVYAFLSGTGAVASKLRSWKWLFRNLPLIIRKRRRIQAIRERSDRELLVETDFTIPLDQFELSPSYSKIAERALSIVYRPWHWIVTHDKFLSYDKTV